MNILDDLTNLDYSLLRLEEKIDDLKTKIESGAKTIDSNKLELAGLTSAQQKALSTGNPGKWHDKLGVCKIGGINMPPEYCGRKQEDVGKPKRKNTSVDAKKTLSKNELPKNSLTNKEVDENFVEKGVSYFKGFFKDTEKKLKKTWKDYESKLSKLKKDIAKKNISTTVAEFGSFVISLAKKTFDKVILSTLDALRGTKIPFISSNAKKAKKALIGELGLKTYDEHLMKDIDPELIPEKIEEVPQKSSNLFDKVKNFIKEAPNKPQNMAILGGLAFLSGGIISGIAATLDVLIIGKASSKAVEAVSKLESKEGMAKILEKAKVAVEAEEVSLEKLVGEKHGKYVAADTRLKDILERETEARREAGYVTSGDTGLPPRAREEAKLEVTKALKERTLAEARLSAKQAGTLTKQELQAREAYETQMAKARNLPRTKALEALDEEAKAIAESMGYNPGEERQIISALNLQRINFNPSSPLKKLFPPTENYSESEIEKQILDLKNFLFDKKNGLSKEEEKILGGRILNLRNLSKGRINGNVFVGELESSGLISTKQKILEEIEADYKATTEGRRLISTFGYDHAMEEYSLVTGEEKLLEKKFLIQEEEWGKLQKELPKDSKAYEFKEQVYEKAKMRFEKAKEDAVLKKKKAKELLNRQITMMGEEHGLSEEIIHKIRRKSFSSGDFYNPGIDDLLEKNIPDSHNKWIEIKIEADKARESAGRKVRETIRDYDSDQYYKKMFEAREPVLSNYRENLPSVEHLEDRTKNTIKSLDYLETKPGGEQAQKAIEEMLSKENKDIAEYLDTPLKSRISQLTQFERAEIEKKKAEEIADKTIKTSFIDFFGDIVTSIAGGLYLFTGTRLLADYSGHLKNTNEEPSFSDGLDWMKECFYANSYIDRAKNDESFKDTNKALKSEKQDSGLGGTNNFKKNADLAFENISNGSQSIDNVATTIKKNGDNKKMLDYFSKVLKDKGIDAENMNAQDVAKAIENSPDIGEVVKLKYAINAALANSPKSTWKKLSESLEKGEKPDNAVILDIIKSGINDGYSLGALISQLTAAGVRIPSSVIKEATEKYGESDSEIKASAYSPELEAKIQKLERQIEYNFIF